MEFEVTGVFHGGVSSVIEVLENRQSYTVSLWLHQLLRECRKSATYPTGETSREVFVKLLCDNEVQERFTDDIQNPTIDEWEDTLDLLTTRRDPILADESLLDSFPRNQLRAWTGRRFFRTQNEYLGSGPGDTKPGDQICVILGPYCPLVIRPFGHGRYHIVGACFVHGSTCIIRQKGNSNLKTATRSLRLVDLTFLSIHALIPDID